MVEKNLSSEEAVEPFQDREYLQGILAMGTSARPLVCDFCAKKDTKYCTYGSDDPNRAECNTYKLAPRDLEEIERRILCRLGLVVSE